MYVKIIVLLCFLLTHSVNLFASEDNKKNQKPLLNIDTDNSLLAALDFYPLSFGNKWIYLNSGVADSWDNYEYLVEKEVVGDTIMSNNKKYAVLKRTIYSGEYNDEEYLFERIDSLSGKVYGFETYGQEEWIVEDLFASVNDTFPGSHYCLCPNSSTWFYKEDSLKVFEETQEARYYQSFDLSEHNYALVKNIGVGLDAYTFDFGSGTHELKGAIINGRILGDTTIVWIKSETIIPDCIEVYPNSPNPFNNSTRLEYYLSKKSKVKLTVFDILGKKIITLVNEVQNSGAHYAIWSGCDILGYSVGSGIYIYKFESNGFTKSGRMILIK